MIKLNHRPPGQGVKMLYDFLVEGSAGPGWYKAVSQEWAMVLYKVEKGLNEAIKSVEWVQ